MNYAARQPDALARAKRRHIDCGDFGRFALADASDWGSNRMS
jgi:hypothetical protein